MEVRDAAVGSSTLADKHVLITGAGCGIGRATALAMSRAGAVVGVVDLDGGRAAEVVSAIRAQRGVAEAICADVSDAHSIREAFDSAIRAFGYVDVLFNNAGIAVPKDALETTPDEWRRTIDVNVGGVWNGCREFIQRLRDTGRPGAIVNTASVNAFFAEPSFTAYCASKGAVLALTRALAIDHAGDGIRVNCVCPGYVETGMTGPMFDAQPDPVAAREEAGRLHALGRIGRAEEIAQVVVFLASDAASFVTGAAYVVDGGMTIGKAIF